MRTRDLATNPHSYAGRRREAPVWIGRGSGDWRLETGDWRLEIGDWRLEIGDWRLETGEGRGTVRAHNRIFTM